MSNIESFKSNANKNPIDLRESIEDASSSSSSSISSHKRTGKENRNEPKNSIKSNTTNNLKSNDEQVKQKKNPFADDNLDIFGFDKPQPKKPTNTKNNEFDDDDLFGLNFGKKNNKE